MSKSLQKDINKDYHQKVQQLFIHKFVEFLTIVELLSLLCQVSYFSAELRLLRLLLELDFGSTNLPLNFLRAPSRSKYCLTPQPVLELFPQSTLPTNFHSLVSKALFL